MDMPRKEGKRKRYPSGKTKTLRYLSVFTTIVGLALVGVGLTAGPASASATTYTVSGSFTCNGGTETGTITGSGYGANQVVNSFVSINGTDVAQDTSDTADASGNYTSSSLSFTPGAATTYTLEIRRPRLGPGSVLATTTQTVNCTTPAYATVTSHAPFSAAANDPSYWGSGCTKIAPGGDSYVLPAGTYSQVIVKAGSGQYANTVFAAPPTAGQTVWADTNNNGQFDPSGPGGDKQISHVILCAGTPPPPPCVTLTTANVSQYGSLVWAGNSATVTLTPRNGGYCNDWTFDVSLYEPAAFPQTVKQVDAASVGKSGLSATATVNNTTCGQIDGYEGSGPTVGSTLSGPGKDYESNHKFLSQIFGGPDTWTIATGGCTTPTPKDASGDFTLTGVCGTGNDTVTPTAVNATAGQPVWNGTKVSVTFTANNGHLFPNGQSTLTVTKNEVDTSACPVSSTPPPPPTTVVPAGPLHATPDCTSQNETVTPSNQVGVVWNPAGSTVLNPGESVTYTATPAAGYAFPAGAQTSWTFQNGLDVTKCKITSSSPKPSHSKHNSPPPTHHQTKTAPPSQSTTTVVPVTSPYTPGPGSTGDSLAKTGSLKRLLIEVGIALIAGGLIPLATSSRRRGARQH